MEPLLSLNNAICLARELHHTLSFPEQEQKIKYEQYKIDNNGLFVIDELKEISCSYVTPVSVLAQEIQKRRNVTIEFYDSDVATRVPGLGRLKNKSSVIEVLTPTGATYCLKRFAYLKELIHQWDEKYISKDTSARNLVQVIEAARRSIDPNTHQGAIHIENFCFYCAIEILIPWGPKRDELIKLRNERLPDLVIARVFRLPLMVVQFLAQSNYIELSNKINIAIDYTN